MAVCDFFRLFQKFIIGALVLVYAVIMKYSPGGSKLELVAVGHGFEVFAFEDVSNDIFSPEALVIRAQAKSGPCVDLFAIAVSGPYEPTR